MNISSATYQKDRFDSSINEAVVAEIDGVTMIEVEDVKEKRR